MEKIFEAEDGIIRATTPSTPPSGQRSLYPKSDGWYDLSSAGVEKRLLSGTSGISSYRAVLLGANGSLTSTTAGKNDFAGITITGAYSAEGVYTLTADSAAFTANKTNVQLSLGTATGGVILKAELTSTTVITIKSFLVTDGTTAADFIGTIYVDVTVDA